MVHIGAVVVRDVPPDQVTRHVAPLVDHLDELWVVEDLGCADAVIVVPFGDEPSAVLTRAVAVVAGGI